MSEEETVSLPASGTRPSHYKHIYTGRFNDKNPDIRAAGILTYQEGENVQKSIRQTIYSAPNKLPPNEEKYSLYRYPNLGEIKFHYGVANDPKYYYDMTHGVRSDDKSFTTKDCINPPQATRFQHLRNEMSEGIYNSRKTASLGRIPRGNLPDRINPYTTTFGVKSVKSESAKESINPSKLRYQVELESSDKHDMYVYSHQDYEPGEQKDRQFTQAFDRNTRFGAKTDAYYDGRNVKNSLINLPLRNLDKRAQFDTRLLDNFREKHTSQVGEQLDPNKDTRFLGPDHTFGLLNREDNLNAGDVLHNRTSDRVLKGKEKERTHVAVARNHLARYNYSKFKTLADAFKFYDQDGDGVVNRDELKYGFQRTGFPLADDYLDAVIRSCDKDGDGKISFLEFVNFLCYKESMPPGVDLKSENQEIKDKEGKAVLLRNEDIEHKFHVGQNELVPRTLNNQLDSKVGSWKTTYDIINDAPFRLEPIKKRIYGVPSIRNDIIAPEFKKIQDKTNYGNDGTAWSLLTPSVFAQHGIYENDVLQPRSKEEIHQIFTKVGYSMPPHVFDQTWETAKSLNPYGEVSVEEFRAALDQQIVDTRPQVPSSQVEVN